MGLYIDTSKPPKQYYGLNNLDEKLEKYLNYDNGYFVELGANNGIHQSNTLYYEKFRNWKGVLIEPILHNFLQCKLNRSRESKFFCNACVSFDYKDKFVEILYSNLMSISKGLESDISNPESHALEGKKFLHPLEENVVFGSLAKTLNSILSESNAPKQIDLLSLDVEGAEIEVLKGLDHTDFRFKYMCIECRDIDKLNSYLEKYDYKLIDQLSHWDYVFASS